MTLQLLNAPVCLLPSLYFFLSVVKCWAGSVHCVYQSFFSQNSSLLFKAEGTCRGNLVYIMPSFEQLYI